ncbi:MAG: marine proteobacterial sortase target protein, partial [Candidatus Rokuibacteriota bacterium]
MFWRTAEQDTLVPAPTLKTDVSIVVTGIVARASVRQEFTNPSRAWAEGIYVFPLPEDAAVDRLRMRVGDRVIEGVIHERSTAKAQYEQAKQEGRRASLVEQERPNIFTTSVANIAPDAAITIEIEYQQTVRYDAGEFRLRFPMVVGPRYIPGAPAPGPAAGTGWSPDTVQVPDASRITPPVEHPSRGPVNPVSLTVELDSGAPLGRLTASYHAVQTTPLADGRYRIELAAGPVPADRDFELVWQPTPGSTPIATLFTERKGAETFAVLMVTPPASAAPDGRLPREVIFVLDNSGSMHGASIDQAKAALKLALERLRPGDRFNVIRFNHTTDAVFPAARAATRQNVAAASHYVGRLHANGGTEMLPALREALDGQEHPGRLRQVIFLTDGAVGNEAQLFAAIHERLGDSRLFTIGIGSAPNSHFMREAARLGRGTFTYIGSLAEVKDKMVALFAKVESPALTDVEIESVAGAEIVPERIPDVYLGEPITVALRVPTLPSRVVLRGRLGVEVWERELVLHPAGEGAGLSSHWARGKIAALLDRRRTGSTEDEVRPAVLELALRHHLV